MTASYRSLGNGRNVFINDDDITTASGWSSQKIVDYTAGGGGSGNVSAASTFSNDNRIVRTDTVAGSRNIQQSALTITDAGSLLNGSNPAIFNSGGATSTDLTLLMFDGTSGSLAKAAPVTLLIPGTLPTDGTFLNINSGDPLNFNIGSTPSISGISLTVSGDLIFNNTAPSGTTVLAAADGAVELSSSTVVAVISGIFRIGNGGVNTYDFPASVGTKGQTLKVNTAENALEFDDVLSYFSTCIPWSCFGNGLSADSWWFPSGDLNVGYFLRATNANYTGPSAGWLNGADWGTASISLPAAGTYKMTFYNIQANDCGIIDFNMTFNGVSITTWSVDLYDSSSYQAGHINTFTVTEPGLLIINPITNGKNGSSSGYSMAVMNEGLYITRIS